MKTPKRIHIIGSVGSGKTTLAKELSVMLHIPYYELDNVVWIRHKSGDIRRNNKEKEQHLHAITQSESWIIEGVHNGDWVMESFQHADLIIFLDIRYSIRTYRIIKRFLFQKIQIEKSNYKPSMKIFFNMFKWNKHFEKVGKPTFYNKLGRYREKLYVVTKNSTARSYFNY